MNHRRAFLQTVAGLGAGAAAAQALPEVGETDRQYWVRTMGKVAEPVLSNLAAGTLKRNMPVECVTGNVADRRRYTHLEALGRLLAGIAPWLEAALPAGGERDAQQRYAKLAREAIRSASDPQSPDYLTFYEGSQPLVDCGFLAQALLRAPNELWKKLDAPVQRKLAAALASSRAITPGFKQLAVVLRHGGGRAGAHGRTVGRHAHRLCDSPAPAVVRRRRRVRRRPALPLGLLQQLRDPADAAGCAAEYRSAQPELGQLSAGHAGTGETVRGHPRAPDRSRWLVPGGGALGDVPLRRVSLAGANGAPRPVAGRTQRSARARCADGGGAPNLGRAGNFRRRRVADGWLLRPPAALGRELQGNREPVSLRDGSAAAGPRAGPPVLDRRGRRLDVAPHLAWRRRTGGPFDLKGAPPEVRPLNGA